MVALKKKTIRIREDIFHTEKYCLFTTGLRLLISVWRCVTLGIFFERRYSSHEDMRETNFPSRLGRLYNCLSSCCRVCAYPKLGWFDMSGATTDNLWGPILHSMAMGQFRGQLSHAPVSSGAILNAKPNLLSLIITTDQLLLDERLLGGINFDSDDLVFPRRNHIQLAWCS